MRSHPKRRLETTELTEIDRPASIPYLRSAQEEGDTKRPFSTDVWPLSSSDCSGSSESCHVTLLRLFPSNVDKEDFGEGEHDEVGVTGGVRRPEVLIRGVGDVVVVVAVAGAVRCTEVVVVVVDTGALEGVVGVVGVVDKGLEGRPPPGPGWGWWEERKKGKLVT
ncbi:hypothetical protein CRUP_014738 [Coryphaenoides rupestris]|nr:hypothetical protein CRUP_014738 [Coryphaenoides rupestris]